jgi:hypothetical protein
MAGAFAASLGAIAMVTVILRGALAGEAAVDCIFASVGALLAFAAFGWCLGAAMDYLIRQDLEIRYRRRVELYRKEFEARFAEPTNSRTPRR